MYASVALTALLATVRDQSTAVATLERALANDRVASAYLFDGPSGVGKELAAFGLAQALVCSELKGAAACGVCSACLRAMPFGERKLAKHPDIVVLGRAIYAPEQIGRRTPETQELSIDQIRTLVLARFAFPPHEGRARVFIVRAAEEMSTSAANALLKVLEEPGSNTYFILLSSTPDALLPTIRSRTLRIRFGPLPQKTVKELVTGRVPQGTEEEAARFARGSVEEALRLSNAEEIEKKNAFVEKAVAAIGAVSLREALELGEEAKKVKERLGEWLGALAAHFWSKRETAEGELSAKSYTETLRALRELDGNASPQLTIEALFMRLRALR